MVRRLLFLLFLGANLNLLYASDYFVKPTGSGDGSSWEKAMGAADFEAYLPLVADSTTFHIAEGVYVPKSKPEDVAFGREDEGMFVAKTYVRLIGGYPANAKTGDAPNPALYKTVFSGDVNGDTKATLVKGIDGRDSLAFANTSDDLYCVFYCSQSHGDGINPDVFEADTAIYMSGIVFSHASTYGLYLDHSYNGFSHIENSTFEFGDRWACQLQQAGAVFSNCVFRNNEIGFSRYDGEANRNRSIIFRGCTFDSNNGAFRINGLYTGTTLLENSTLVNNHNSTWASVSSYLNLTNCTVLNNGGVISNSCYNKEKYFTLVGNVIDTLSFVNHGPNATHFDARHNYGNISFGDNAEVEQNANLPMKSRTELTSFVEGTYDAKSDAFTPSLTGTDGFVPTVALKSDKLADGTSIRFPLSETTVTTDQRGMKRLVQTCMGAYEANCVAAHTEIADTIFLGAAYTFGGTKHQPSKPGRMELTDTLATTLGCDSIVTLRLVVMPDPKQLNYYVKVDGKGDGSSWEKAMSAEDFEYFVSNVPNGVTFHIAEGKYVPTDVSVGTSYDTLYYAKWPQAHPRKKSAYQVNNTITIVGGYPANAKSGAVADPKKYETIFSGDLFGDDKGTLNNIDNASFIFDIASFASVSGLVFEGAYRSALHYNVLFDGEAIVEKCVFRYNRADSALYDGVVYAGHVSPNSDSKLSHRIHVKNSHFYKNNGVLFSAVCDNETPVFLVENCTFEENDGKNPMISSDYLNACFDGWDGVYNEIRNSTFVNNAYRFLFRSTSGLSLYNNTFVNNKTEKLVSVIDYDYAVRFMGNLFLTEEGVFSSYNSHDAIESDYNIYCANVPSDILGKHDYVTTKDITSELYGEVALSSNGGFVPTLALKSDRLADGTSIRFPLSETTVTTDQRGMKRLVQTCMGAYEANCVAAHTEIADTIFLGAAYTFGGTKHQPSKPGRMELTDTLATTLGCDSIVTLRLVVMPDPKQLNYYVKVDGKGDGSSWEKAMSGEEFEVHLPLVRDSVTFHIAEGVYVPKFVSVPYGIVDNKEPAFVANSFVRLIGGYSSNAKTGDVPDPALYKTVFSGDVNNDTKVSIAKTYDGRDSLVFSNNSDDLFYVFICSQFREKLINPTISETDTSLYISGIVFRYGRHGGLELDNSLNSYSFIENSTFEYNFYGIHLEQSATVISSCVFRNNWSGFHRYIGEAHKTRSINFKGCTFDSNNKALYIDGLRSGTTFIENSTFVNNFSYQWAHVTSGLNMQSSTILNNRGCIYNLRASEKYITLIGNVIDTLSFVSHGSEMTYFRVHDNYGGINLGDDAKLDQSVNLQMSGISELSSFLEGTYNPETHIFTPVLKDNGGFTPTVALKSDKLADGTSIRFPLSETTVTTDQRGVKRLESTCMGAYEINCLEVNTSIADTILMGDTYAFGGTERQFDKPGRVEMKDTFTAVTGCDSIVTLQLVVRPDHSRSGYYVKADGTGDGSDWEHAMGPEDFAAYLPFVYDGDTFHIAAGRYHPLLEVADLGKGFEFNASVALVGGYPDTVKEVGTPSNPDLHKTILTADMRGNDAYTVYPHLTDVSISGLADNAQLLLHTQGTHTLSLYGLTLGGVVGCDHGMVCLEGSSLRMERCEVLQNNASAIVGKGGNVWVDNCYFADNVATRGAVFRLENAVLTVRSSAFERNVTEAGCGADYEQTQGGVASLADCVASFTNNTFNLNRSGKGGVFAIEATRLSLTNNTITGCGNVETDKNTGSVVYARGGKSNLNLHANIIVGNGANPFAVASDLSMSAKTDYNIGDAENQWIVGEHDMRISPAEISTILDGDYVLGATTYFIGNLRQNGGYTPVLAVVASSFKGGKVLSVPKMVRRVDVDQRGFVRKDTSCVGAYEFPTLYDYYVKKRPAGDGSGRSWANAMGDTTFARYFPIVSNGATFHIAEGRYQQPFDGYGRPTASTQRAYRTDRLVNLVGGYPADAEEGATPDPKASRTLLTADFNGDDEVQEVAGTDKFTLANRSDNGAYVMEISPKVAGWCEISGLEFEGSVNPKKSSSAALTLSSKNTRGVNYRLSQCSFERDIVGIYSITDSLIVSECNFSYAVEKALGHSSRQGENPPHFLFDKNTLYKNQDGISLTMVGDAVVQNSTFAMSGRAACLSVQSFDDRKLACALYNNTISQSGNRNAGVEVFGQMDLSMVGNIMNDKLLIFDDKADGAFTFHSDYNLYSSDANPSTTAWKMGEHDVLATRRALSEVLDGTYEEESGLFWPTLTDNGGFCRNIALVNTTLPEGRSVKMIPARTTPVTDDQRGVRRDEVYCVGAYEVACGFEGATFALKLDDALICRDDTARVRLAGLSKLEENTYKYEWTTDADSVYLLDGAGSSARFHVYAKRSEVTFTLKVTDACGADTTMRIAQRVGGTADVTFDGLADGVACGTAGPTLLTSDEENALFEGECVVDGRYFDPSLAKGEFTQVRCWAGSGECRSFADRKVRLYTRTAAAPLSMRVEEKTLNNCFAEPDAMARITVADWNDDWRCQLRGTQREPINWMVSAVSEATAEYDSLRSGAYLFVVSDWCGAIDSLPFEIAFSAIDPAALVVFDSLAVNSQNCFGDDTGDVKAFYSGNAGRSAIGVRLTRDGKVVSETFSSQEKDTILFSGLEFAEYEVSLYYVGAEECTADMDGLVKRAEVFRPEPFAVSFHPTKTRCQNSSDARIGTQVKGGVANCTYEWHKVVADGDSHIIRQLPTNDTLTGLTVGDSYWCRVTDKRGCEVKSDTIRIETHAADTLQVASFFHDQRQRCKGVDNARMEITFASTNSMKPVFRLEKVTGKTTLLAVEDRSETSDAIRLDGLAPGKYRFWVGYPEEGCRDLMDTLAVISEMTNDFSLDADPDTMKASRCLSAPNGKLCFHAVGAANGQSALLYQDDELLAKLKPTKMKADTACYKMSGLGSGSYKVVMENVCHEQAANEYAVEGITEFKLQVVDSLSVLKLKCPYDKNGKIVFKQTQWNDDAAFSMISDTTIRRTLVKEETVYERKEVVRVDSVFVMDTLRHADGEVELVHKRDASGNVMKDTVHRRTIEEVPVVVKKEYVEEQKAKAHYRGTFATTDDGTTICSPLPPNTYTLICQSTLEGCADSTSLDVKVSVPKNVTLKSEVMPISCSTLEDGVVSFKPKRDTYDSDYVISRDSVIYKTHYDLNYVFEKKKKKVPAEDPFFEDETVEKVTYEPLMLGDDTLAVRINALNHKSELLAVHGSKVRTVSETEKSGIRFSYGKEFVSCEWSIKEKDGWKRLRSEDIQLPDSSDDMQAFYYKDAAVMAGPVWGCSHLETFCDDKEGRYSEIGAMTLANLKPTLYAVEVRDTNNCFYRDTFAVIEPENALKIDSVKYDENALCNPELRRITAYASGGWGEYVFSFSDSATQEDGGGEWNGYLGGEATHYDAKKKNGWGRSRFLNPGKYAISVMDDKGCIVSSDKVVEVRTNVLVHADTAVTLCPGEKKALVELRTSNTHPPKYTGKYLIKEHVSPCNGMVPDCVTESFDTLMITDADVPVVELGGGGHGLFVYEYNPNGTLACGGYVEVTVLDTVWPMNLQRKDVHDVRCKGESSGSIELYLSGGRAPYDIIRNSAWGVDDTLRKWHVEQGDLEWFAEGVAYYTVTELDSGSYFFTLRDADGCRRVMGDTLSSDGSIKVGEPSRLEALVISPSICANADSEADEFKGGVSAAKVRGGLPPYSYEVVSDRDGVTISSDVPMIEVRGDRNTLFNYAVIDSNECRVDTTLKFREETVEVDRYDFLASTWMYNGDVVALIDFCGPDVNFDSVSYVFSNPRVELLDKRMFIYDIAGGTEEHRNAISGIDTKTIVPDGFFEQNFRLLVDTLLAKHINFIRVNDTTGLSKTSNGDSCWLRSSVTMSAYFKGCRYVVEKSDLKVAYDNITLYGGGVERKKDILDVTVSPNPRRVNGGESVTITLTLSSRLKCDLYLYHVDGKEDIKYTFDENSVEYREEMDVEHDKVYKITKQLSAADLEKMKTEVVVVFVKTDHDAAGTYLLQVP